MVNQGSRSHVLELLGYMGVVFIFLLFNLYLATKISYIQVELTIESEAPGNFQVFWRQDGSPFEEKKSIVLKIHPDRSTYSFKISSFANFDRLRIDPVDDKQAVHIKKLFLHHNLYRSVTIFPQESEVVLTSSNDLETVQQSKENGIYIVPAGTDPSFEIKVDSSLDMVIFYSFVILTFGGAFLLYILMNQTLLKVRRESATVLVNIPQNDQNCSKEVLLQVLRKNCPGSKLVSIQAQPEFDKYIFDFPIVKDSALMVFLKEVRKLSHLIHCRVHYNRSGEV